MRDRGGCATTIHIAIFAEEQDIDDFKNAECVDDKQYDEPPALVVTSGIPQRCSFPREGPDEHDDKDNGKD